MGEIARIRFVMFVGVDVASSRRSHGRAKTRNWRALSCMLIVFAGCEVFGSDV